MAPNVDGQDDRGMHPAAPGYVATADSIRRTAESPGSPIAVPAPRSGRPASRGRLQAAGEVARGGENARHAKDLLAVGGAVVDAAQMGGDSWQKWCDALLAASLPRQRQDGSLAGSWDPVDAHGKEIGRIGATALQLHALLVVRRQMALSRR